LGRMLILRKVAVTGSLAAGKSTACRFLKKLGAYTLNSDEIAHKLLLKNTPLKKEIIKLLGKQILTKNEVDRRKVAKVVFQDNKKLNQLEKLIHPKVLKEITKQYRQAKKENKYRLFIVEVPLLEKNLKKFFDAVVYITALKKLRQKRFKKTSFAAREKRQASLKKQKGFVLKNNQSLKHFKKQITNLYRSLNQEEKHE
jgi:dephospho-CoA kinase